MNEQQLFPHQCNAEDHNNKDFPHFHQLKFPFLSIKNLPGRELQSACSPSFGVPISFYTLRADLTYARAEEVSRNYDRNVSPRVLP